jgi:hypothetical protein
MAKPRMSKIPDSRGRAAASGNAQPIRFSLLQSELIMLEESRHFASARKASTTCRTTQFGMVQDWHSRSELGSWGTYRCNDRSGQAFAAAIRDLAPA